jgi:G patch domain-containing protein 1
VLTRHRYFNTVGSKEGWTPSTFVSSRSNRRKDDPKLYQQRAEDYMDDEDLADVEESRKLKTTESFAGLGLTEQDGARTGGLAGLFRVQGDTMGTKLLKKMGWKEGQGVGPKVRRAARLDVGMTDAGKKTHLFAPENVAMIAFVRKSDHKGLGFGGESELAPIDPSRWTEQDGTISDVDDDFAKPAASLSFMAKKRQEKPGKGGMGVGILNDTGSDDEDPYEIGPRISYNRVVGGDKKKKKKERESLKQISSDPRMKMKPVFTSKRAGLGKLGTGVRRGHDGKLPLDGFIFGAKPDALISEVNAEGKYPPPSIPVGWKSSKQPDDGTGTTPYVSTADAAKASKLDPRSRAAALGEAQLPGKSVFDFMSAASRERLVAATGRTDLPEARGEVAKGFEISEEEKRSELLRDVPQLDKETAIAAIARGVAGGGPYSEDEAKRSRYRAYLEVQAGSTNPLPAKPAGMSNDDWLREFHEFYNCARIFKPMSGFMASRFTTSASTKMMTGSNGQTEDKDLVSKRSQKPPDPAEEAAKMGMFGHLTRTVEDFYPTRLLCKRLNVKPPAHVQPDQDPPGGGTSKTAAGGFGEMSSRPYDGAVMDFGRPGSGIGATPEDATRQADGPLKFLAIMPNAGEGTPAAPQEVVVDATRNEALEGKRAGEEVFRAIFGDSSDDED